MLIQQRTEAVDALKKKTLEYNASIDLVERMKSEIAGLKAENIKETVAETNAKALTR
jgi:hypothetical protein